MSNEKDVYQEIVAVTRQEYKEACLKAYDRGARDMRDECSALLKRTSQVFGSKAAQVGPQSLSGSFLLGQASTLRELSEAIRALRPETHYEQPLDEGDQKLSDQQVEVNSESIGNGV